MSEDGDFDILKLTPEETGRFVADLKDPTEPLKYENALVRLWTQVKKLAGSFVRKMLYGAIGGPFRKRKKSYAKGQLTAAAA